MAQIDQLEKTVLLPTQDQSARGCDDLHYGVLMNWFGEQLHQRQALIKGTRLPKTRR